MEKEVIQTIAEIGWNFLGDLELATNMIIKAKESGATYAKFQTWSVDRLKDGEWDNDGRREIYQKAELDKSDHEFLIRVCDTVGIKFLSSVFSVADAELLVELGVKDVKIPSFESRNVELIQYCDEHFDTVIMSTGTSTVREIVNNSRYYKNAEWWFMHCVSSYPCEYKNGNLPKMKALMDYFDNVGYSDHIMGVESAKIAIGEGAKIIEKHFTTNRNLAGRDNKFAILPDELKDLTDYIRNRELMLVDLGEGYQDVEVNQRENYSGRFNG